MIYWYATNTSAAGTRTGHEIEDEQTAALASDAVWLRGVVLGSVKPLFSELHAIIHRQEQDGWRPSWAYYPSLKAAGFHEGAFSGDGAHYASFAGAREGLAEALGRRLRRGFAPARRAAVGTRYWPRCVLHEDCRRHLLLGKACLKQNIPTILRELREIPDDILSVRGGQ